MNTNNKHELFVTNIMFANVFVNDIITKQNINNFLSNQNTNLSSTFESIS